MTKAIQLLFIGALLISTSGCKENTIPKPHGYLRLDIPKDHVYISSPEELPFKLEHSKYSEWEKLEANKQQGRNNLWFNINYKAYKGKIHLSYIPIQNNLDSLIEESHKFVFEHTVRAEAINETPFQNTEKNIHGVLFDIEGNTASNMEFWVTDSTEHFLRGALYFSTTPNIDSLAPIIDYVKKDITVLINSLEWTCQ